MSFSSKSRLQSLPAGNSWGLTSSFDEERWVIHIRQSLDEKELEEDIGAPVCIFNVPKSLMAIHPDSYTPQEVAIGPYHHWRQELYEMERYKIAAAKRAQKRFQSLKFHDLVEKLTKYEQKTRACYHKYLNFNSETVAWMMAIDSSFLLEVLQVYTIREEKSISRVSSKLSYLVDYEGRKSAHNAVLRDMVMLENQIPLFVLRKMLELQFLGLEAADQLLLSMLLGLYENLSPFKVMEDVVELQVSVSECFHVLDFLYQMVTPKLADPLGIMEDDQNQKEPAKVNVESTFEHSFSPLRTLGSEIWKILSKLNRGPAHLFRRLVGSRPLLVVFKLPWAIISKLPGIRLLIKPLEHLCSLRKGKEENDPEKGSSRKDGKVRLPLLEEISIPSVSELTKSGVCFLPIDGGVSAVAFDTKAVILYLPTISLDVNSEVLFRNLVAYEASKPSGPLVFTRFIELLNGIIDSEEDVKLLKEKGIILNHLKSDAEVAELWNGMSKSIKLTKVPFLDKVIKDVNKHYDSRWKVKAAKFLEKFVFGSWPLLALLFTILLLAMTTLQAFCSVYTCSRFSHHLNTAGT